MNRLVIDLTGDEAREIMVPLPPPDNDTWSDLGVISVSSDFSSDDDDSDVDEIRGFPTVEFDCPLCQDPKEEAVACAAGHRVCTPCFKLYAGMKGLEEAKKRCFPYNFCTASYA